MATLDQSEICLFRIGDLGTYHPLMHWTALLRDQTLPPNARVAGDLPCVSCGYNLRLAKPAGLCPECGHEVLSSVRAATEPRSAAVGLRRLGASFLAAYGYVLVLSYFWSGWPLLPGFFILGVGIVLRLLAVYSLLRSVAGMAKVGQWMTLLWIVAWVEAIVLCFFASSGVIGLDGSSTTMDDLFNASRQVWLLAIVAQMALVGMLGLLMARTLGYALLRWESTLLLVLLIMGTMLAGATAIIVAAATGSIGDWWQLAERLWLIPAGASVALTAVLLLHLSNAAERTRDRIEDVLDASP